MTSPGNPALQSPANPQAIPGAPPETDQVRQDAAAATAAVRANTDLSNEAAARKMAQIHVAATRKMADLQQRANAWRQQSVTSAQNAAWGIDDIPGAAGNRPAISMSYRDAQDRAAQLDTPQEAAALLAQANETDDELLARAIARHVYTLGVAAPFPVPAWSAVLDDYLATRPRAQAAVDKLIRLTKQPAPAVAMFTYVVPPPSELAGMRPDQIEALAAGDQQSA